MLSATTAARSNHTIFVPENNGSPNNDLFKHISKLGSIARLDFERCSVAGEVIYTIEGDVSPIGQQDEEARIGTLAYAIKKLGRQHQTSDQQSAKAADPAPRGRVLGELPRKSRTYRQYLKSLNKIDRELLNEAVHRRLEECGQMSGGKRENNYQFETLEHCCVSKNGARFVTGPVIKHGRSSLLRRLSIHSQTRPH